VTYRPNATKGRRELPDLTAARIEPATDEPGVEARPLWRRSVEALVPPLVALVAGWTLIAVRSPYGGWQLFDPLSYARWDSGLYVHIARSGYFAVQCTQHTSQAPPGTYLCGTVSWFPGYPFAIRALSTVTGLSLATAGLVIAWACWYLVLVLMWRLLADARSASTRWACLLIAAFFPGQVYFAALFPISLCIAAILGCLYLALRPYRPVLAWAGFAAGFVAAYSYLTAIVLVPALLVTALLVLRGRSRLQTIIPAAGAAAGFGAVLLTMQAAVGIWNAYFISEQRWGVGGHNPLDTFINRLRPFWTPLPPGSYVSHYTAEQTLLTLCFVGLACLVTIIGAVHGRPTVEEPQRGWAPAIQRHISAFDLTFLLMTLGVWVVPYIAGGSASTYRSEAFVIVGVPLLRRLPAWLLVVPLGAAVWVAWHMAPYFFNGKLI
jgi:hypothetical protein